MSNAILNLGGWGLFYGGLLLYVVWVVAERTFFAGRDPERWDPASRDAMVGGDPQPRAPFPSAVPLGRAA